MRAFVAVLAVLALLMGTLTVGLSVYNWLTFNRQLTELYRRDSLASQQRNDLQRELSQQIIERDKALILEMEARLQRSQDTILRRLRAVEQRRETTQSELLITGIFTTLATAERAVYLGQSSEILDRILGTAQDLIAHLPPEQAAALQQSLKDDLAVLSDRPVENLALVLTQIDEVRALIRQLTASCCEQPPQPPQPETDPAEPAEQSLIQELLGSAIDGLKLRRVKPVRYLPPDQQEYALIRAALGGYLAQARLALALRDQAVWDQAWQHFLTESDRLLTEDADKHQTLRQKVLYVAAIDISLHPFRFVHSRQALELEQ